MSDNEKIDPAINELPDPSSFAAPEGGPVKKRKKRELEGGASLSMNSLLDILTIILVFLLKSYSTDPVQLKSAEDLKPPFSTAQLRPSQSTTITLTLSRILVDDKSVAVIDGGVVPEADTSSNGFMVDPLYDALIKAVDHQKKVQKFNKQSTFEGIITIIADRHVPFSLLTKAMYTAGQAEFSKFKFMVVKGGG